MPESYYTRKYAYGIIAYVHARVQKTGISPDDQTLFNWYGAYQFLSNFECLQR